MKVVLLSAASSIHTVRWANGLNSIGIEVSVISQHPQTEPMDDGVDIYILKNKGAIGYFLMVPEVKALLSKIKPDLVNAHYASGYGTTANLANYHPWLLSVWGSDVYDFPYTSFLHKYLVKKNLLSADGIASTSNCMALQTESLASLSKDIHITPFGVDTKKFRAKSHQHNKFVNLSSNSSIIVGTVKTMAHKYGVDTLIKAFSLVVKSLQINNPSLASRLKLRLVGGGASN